MIYSLRIPALFLEHISIFQTTTSPIHNLHHQDAVLSSSRLCLLHGLLGRQCDRQSYGRGCPGTYSVAGSHSAIHQPNHYCQPFKRQASSATSVAASTIASAESSITSAASAAASSASQSAANAASAATASGTAVPSGYVPGGSTGSSGTGDTGGISTTTTKNAGSSIAQGMLFTAFLLAGHKLISC